MAESGLLPFLHVSPSDVQRLYRRSVYFTRPRIVRFYDISDGIICAGKEFQYFREPKLDEYPIDLNGAYESFTFKRAPTNLRRLITLHHEMGNLDVKSSAELKTNNVERTKVYSRRGALTVIMEFCYAHKFEFKILASRYRGNLYLFESDKKLQEFEKAPKYTHHIRLDRQLFVDDPNGLPNLDDAYDDFLPHHLLFSSNLGKFDIIYAAVTKGIKSDTKIQNINDINAINKLRFVSTKQIWQTLKTNSFKFLRIWCQAYLSSIDDVYLAYKDNNSMVTKPIEHIKVSNLPKNRHWKPGVCTAFLNEFLESVEKLMWKEDSLETVYEFNFNVNDHTVKYEIHRNNPEKILVPKEYTDKLR